jgi:hypothetical protein
LNPQLSHNLVRDLTSRPAGADEAYTLSQLRTSLIKVLRNSPESREPICDALELIESLQQRIESKRHPDPPDAPVARAARPSPALAAQQYILQKTPEGDFLTERRPSGSQPFRCPKGAYDAAAKLLADAAEPAHFEELLDRLNAATDERQADYRLRVCLRFWIAKGKVERSRTRYRAVDRATFLADAQSLWNSL